MGNFFILLSNLGFNSPQTNVLLVSLKSGCFFCKKAWKYITQIILGRCFVQHFSDWARTLTNVQILIELFIIILMFSTLYLSMWDIVHIAWNAVHRCSFNTAPSSYLAQEFCHSQEIHPNISTLKAMGNQKHIQNTALWSRTKQTVISNYIWEQELRR